MGKIPKEAFEPWKKKPEPTSIPSSGIDEADRAKKFSAAFDKVVDMDKIKKSLDRQAGRTFTVILRRYGSHEAHNYLCGIFSTYQKACDEAKCSMALRAGKYDAEIYESYLDSGQIEIYRVIHWGDFDPTKYGY